MRCGRPFYAAAQDGTTSDEWCQPIHALLLGLTPLVASMVGPSDTYMDIDAGQGMLTGKFGNKLFTFA